MSSICAIAARQIDLPKLAVRGVASLAVALAGSSVTSARAATPLHAAVALVKAKGYTPDSTRSYRSSATLRVLVATASGSADGHNVRAFFFVGRRYIGTDTAQPNANLAYIGQTSTTVRLRYGIYGPGSGECCPTSLRTVRFHWNGRRLVALDRIPN